MTAPTPLERFSELELRQREAAHCTPDCTPPLHRNPCSVAEAIAEGEAFERGD